MLKKLSYAFCFALVSATCSSQVPASEVQPNVAVEHLSEGIDLAMMEANKVMEGVAPEATETLVGAMKEMLKMMAPVMVAVEENKKLPKADENMAKALEAALPPKYTTQKTGHKIDEATNELKLYGEYVEDATVLKYEFTRNLAQALFVQDIIDGNFFSSDGFDESDATIQNLDGEDISLNRFENFDMDGNIYAGYENGKDHIIFLLTDIGPYLSARIQIKGTDYKELGKDFVYSLDYAAIKKAIADDGKTMPEIKKHIEETVKDSSKIEALLNKQTSQNQ